VENVATVSHSNTSFLTKTRRHADTAEVSLGVTIMNLVMLVLLVVSIYAFGLKARQVLGLALDSTAEVTTGKLLRAAVIGNFQAFILITTGPEC
jgi:hypothetical protein